MSPLALACIGAVILLALAGAVLAVVLLVPPVIDRAAVAWLRRRRREAGNAGVGVPVQTSSGRLMTLRELEDA